MMKTLAALVLLSTTTFAVPPKVLEYDFEPPAFTADQHGQVFLYYLPVQNGFAANINMMAQPYQDTLEAYDELSRAQFEQLGLKLISGEIRNGVLTYEYAGKTQGLDLHWYSRAIKRGDTVFIITATTLAERWKEDAPALMTSAKSFRLKQED